MRALPMWARALGVALALLVVNLLWNHPLREASGGSALAFFLLNLLASAAVIAWIGLGGAPRRR